MAVDPYAVARVALAQIAHPVAIIGAAAGGERSCATGTTMYVSLAPALVAVAQNPESRTARLIQRSGEFSVSLLTQAQQDFAVAAGSSASGPDKFAALKIPALEPPEGCVAPAVAGGIAVLWCKVRQDHATGDHHLFIGEVVAHHVDERKIDALLRFRRRYAHIGHFTGNEAPEGYPT